MEVIEIKEIKRDDRQFVEDYNEKLKEIIKEDD